MPPCFKTGGGTAVRINADTEKIDKLSTIEMVTLFNNEDKKVAEAVSECIGTIAAAVDLMTEKLKKGGRVIYLGSGTSGKLAVIDASECPPTFGIDDNVIIGVISGRIEAVAGWKEEEALKAFEKAGGNARAAILSLVNDSSKIEGD